MADVQHPVDIENDQELSFQTVNAGRNPRQGGTEIDRIS
jgi:hypothetical protein